MKSFILKYYFSFLILIGLTSSLSSQVNVDWERTYGGSELEACIDAKQTLDGGYILAGWTQSMNGDVLANKGEEDFWLLNIASDGNIQWQKNYGGSERDIAHVLELTSDGGFVIAGNTNSNYGDVSSNNGNWDYWIVKVDSSGNIMWEHTFGGSDRDFLYSLEETSDLGFIVAGASYSRDGDVSQNNGFGDYWIIKLDKDGNLQWERNYGGSDYDEARSVLQTNDGGYVVSGLSFSDDGDVGGNEGSRDYWIIKLTGDGDLEWEKNYGGTDWDEPTDILAISDGGYLISGYTRSNDGDINRHLGKEDGWIIKISALGVIEWEKSLGGRDTDVLTSMTETSDGGILAAGYSTSTDLNVKNKFGKEDGWIVKFSNLGNVEWEQAFGSFNNDQIQSISPTDDGGYMLSGLSEKTNPRYDFWVFKLKPISVSTEDRADISSFDILPNPTIDGFWIKPKDPLVNYNLSIFDNSGRQIHIYNNIQGDKYIHQLNKGIYIIELKTASTVRTKKIIIR